MTHVLENEARVDSPEIAGAFLPPRRRRVLIADAGEQGRGQLQQWLQAEPDLEVQTTADGREALLRLLEGDVTLLLTELRLPHADGFQILKEVRQHDLPVTVIVLTAFGSTEDAVHAMRLGAYDFLTKPVDLDHLRRVLQGALRERSLQDELAQLRAQLRDRYSFQNVLSKSPQMHAIFELIHQAAPTSAPVLVEGETGTGKEELARALHAAAAPFRHGPFVTVNCAALPGDLLERELFGQEPDAGGGAVPQGQGRFERADGGTLFLDEVGDLPPPAQAELLRLLQERRIERVGGTTSFEADVRIVSASRRPLQHLVQQNKFREDLFYRLNVIKIDLPPLRQRVEDIPLLATHFCAKYAQGSEKPRQLAPEALQTLLQYHWPGNVRELENAIERACIVCRDDLIRNEHLPAEVRSELASSWPPLAIDLSRPLPQLLRDAVAYIEKNYLRQALKRTHGHVSRCAEICGLSRRSVTAKIGEYGLDKKAFKWA
jgi:DNA-binding NtrC family response regulator